MRREKSCGFLHTHPLIHPFYLVNVGNSSWWFGHHSLLHYTRCVGRWFLFIMIRTNGDLGRRRHHHYRFSYCWEEGKSIFFFLFLSSFFFFFHFSTRRTDVGLSKKCWSTRMFVISFQRTHGSHISTCSLGKKQSSKGRTYIHIKDRPYMLVTKVSAVM